MGGCIHMTDIPVNPLLGQLFLGQSHEWSGPDCEFLLLQISYFHSFCIFSEVTRILPSLESLQKVFDQQLPPGIHRHSQVWWSLGIDQTGTGQSDTVGRYTSCPGMSSGIWIFKSTFVLFTCFLTPVQGAHATAVTDLWHCFPSPFPQLIRESSSELLSVIQDCKFVLIKRLWI